MWPFSKEPTKERLQAYRKVVVQGMNFTIRRISPLTDFDGIRTPQIFTDTTRGKKPDLTNPSVVKRVREDMAAVIQAGVVTPKLAGPGKPGLNVDDMFRDPDLANQLYMLILEHSLLKLRAWQLPFFFLAKRLISLVIWLRPTAFDHATSPLKVRG